MASKEAMEAAEASKAAAKPKPKATGVLRRIADRTGGDSIGAAKGVPQRRVTFLMAAETCAPGLFDDDFDLTLTSLTSKTELEAAKKAKGDPGSLSMWFAYYSMRAVNGEIIDDGVGERDLLWESLGTSGRQVVMGVFASTCMGDIAAMGKAIAGARFE